MWCRAFAGGLTLSDDALDKVQGLWRSGHVSNSSACWVASHFGLLFHQYAETTKERPQDAQRRMLAFAATVKVLLKARQFGGLEKAAGEALRNAMARTGLA